MFLTLLNFSASIIAGLSIVILLKNYKINTEFNVFFLIILLNFCLWRFVYSMNNLGFIELNPSKNIYAIGLFMCPVLIFYFKKFLNRKITLIDLLLQFSLGLLLFILFLENFVNPRSKIIILIIYTLFFFIQLYLLVSKYYSKIPNHKKRFLILMLSQAIYIGVLSNISLIKNTQNKLNIMSDLFDYNLFLWIIILIYMYVKPDLLYGERRLNLTLNYSKISEIKNWSLSEVIKIQSKDFSIYKKVKPVLTKVIIKIDEICENYYLENVDELTYKILQNKINIPKSHLDFLFKYYCKRSKNNFFNFLKIKHALYLIKNNYLEKNTIETLVLASNFKSKTAFYENFKKFTGHNPLELYKNEIYN